MIMTGWPASAPASVEPTPVGRNATGDRHVAVDIQHLFHWFVTQRGDAKAVLNDISLRVQEQEFVAIIGASGCGKTTILNLVAGLERPRQGSLHVAVDGTAIRPPSNRIGYMWARDALLPWRTLQANVEFGLEVRGVRRAERRETASRFIELVGLKGAERRYPGQLSQGMRQRETSVDCSRRDRNSS